MIEDVSRPKHHKSPPRNSTEQLQQPAIPGAVNAGRARDRDRHTRSRRGVAGDPLPFDLCDLIDIARPDGGILGCGRMLDIAVHADRAAVHQPLNPGVGRGFDQRAHRRRVDGAVRRGWDSRLPVHGRDVIDHVDVLHGAGERRVILQRPEGRFDAGALQFSRLRVLPHQRAHRIAASGQRSRQVAACEAGGAGD